METSHPKNISTVSSQETQDVQNLENLNSKSIGLGPLFSSVTNRIVYHSIQTSYARPALVLQPFLESLFTPLVTKNQQGLIQNLDSLFSELASATLKIVQTDFIKHKTDVRQLSSLSITPSGEMQSELGKIRAEFIPLFALFFHIEYKKSIEHYVQTLSPNSKLVFFKALNVWNSIILSTLKQTLVLTSVRTQKEKEFLMNLYVKKQVVLEHLIQKTDQFELVPFDMEKDENAFIEHSNSVYSLLYLFWKEEAQYFGIEPVFISREVQSQLG